MELRWKHFISNDCCLYIVLEVLLYRLQILILNTMCVMLRPGARINMSYVHHFVSTCFLLGQAPRRKKHLPSAVETWNPAMKLQGGSWTNRLLNKGLVASHEEVVKDASCAAEDPHALVDMVAKVE